MYSALILFNKKNKPHKPPEGHCRSANHSAVRLISILSKLLQIAKAATQQ